MKSGAWVPGIGSPDETAKRHLFPGSGLATRNVGEVRSGYVDILREADAILLDELRHTGLYNEVSQAFAVLLSVKSVGVVGAARRYAYVIALRAVKTVDFMTASWAHLPYEFLETVSRCIINELLEVSRVT